ncbi:uncharacterized protein LOC110823614 [Carica papaya]|uniref:uncharacterized protein LOC110823614 n=1 Tax=Carica papaya TaxID=3649 RepID=UPI000B8CE187|nr:uncharacterized protein LOC110823614 [Carica papaya]
MASILFLRLLVILLGLSHFTVCLNAVPVTRIGSKLMHEVPPKTLMQESFDVELPARMDMELNDYPGSGANNRHTPRPQLGRGCVDC